MITPPFLKPGDTVGIVAPAGKLKKEDIEAGLGKLNEWGLNVVPGPNLYNECNQYAGTDAERLADLQTMLDDDSISSVICARGGYGTVRIIDELDFSKFIRRPKWVAGFSDITVLHSHIHSQLGIETLHSAMPYTFPADGSDNEATESLRKALFGLDVTHHIQPHALNRGGNAQGIITGGNLSLLYALNGTASETDTKGKILFIEDVDEYLYHIDRMILNLKRSGRLDHLAALIVGGLTDMKDNPVPFGKSAEEIIAEAVAEYRYPVCFNFPAGHIANNVTLIFGREAKLNISEMQVRLEF